MILAFLLSWTGFVKAMDCVLHLSDLDNCAQLSGISRLPENNKGFGFGFGSVQDVEYMCRTRWHLKVYSCARRMVLSRCSNDSNSHFRQIMWQFIFDTSHYERAANYLCQPYNLKIFRTHKESCLIKHEQNVQSCAEEYTKLLAQTNVRLAQNNPINLTNAEAYANYMKHELITTYCIGITQKIDCITKILERTCSPYIISLVQNYFRESLPSGCETSLRKLTQSGLNRALPQRKLSRPVESSFKVGKKRTVSSSSSSLSSLSICCPNQPVKLFSSFSFILLNVLPLIMSNPM